MELYILTCSIMHYFVKNVAEMRPTQEVTA